jgi:predicted NodU family carbamoyl transferase
MYSFNRVGGIDHPTYILGILKHFHKLLPVGGPTLHNDGIFAFSLLAEVIKGLFGQRASWRFIDGFERLCDRLLFEGFSVKFGFFAHKLCHLSDPFHVNPFDTLY